MPIIKLKEMDEFGDKKRYLFINSGERPLSRSDYSELKNDGLLIYISNWAGPEYRGEEYLIMGKEAKYIGRYFFAKEAVDELKKMGYDVVIDTLDDQNEERKKQEFEESKVRARDDLFGRIFEFIKSEGFYEEGMHYLDGKKIQSNRSPENIYGGGKWITITPEKIWAVTNNGTDGGYWGANNVATGGAGAIGYYIPYNEEIANQIELTTMKREEIEDPDQFSYTPSLPEEDIKTIKSLKDAQKRREKLSEIKEKVEEKTKSGCSLAKFYIWLKGKLNEEGITMSERAYNHILQWAESKQDRPPLEALYYKHVINILKDYEEKEKKFGVFPRDKTFERKEEIKDRGGIFDGDETLWILDQKIELQGLEVEIPYRCINVLSDDFYFEFTSEEPRSKDGYVKDYHKRLCYYETANALLEFNNEFKHIVRGVNRCLSRDLATEAVCEHLSQRDKNLVKEIDSILRSED